ncbi:MAG: hypothetical protein U9Q94_06910 [Candidatus Bipolaricaulota bacterium]|nr:hypothetical protein [Candidatus Bipolaricaulota bacterium]
MGQWNGRWCYAGNGHHSMDRLLVLRDGTQQEHPDNTNWSLGTRFTAGNKSTSYDAATHTLTATWNGADYSNTQMTIEFNNTEDFVLHFYACQTLLSWGWWTTYEIESYDVFAVAGSDGYRHFKLSGATTHTILTKCVYKSWSSAMGSEAFPYYALKDQSVDNLSSDADSFIEIIVNGG